MTERQEKYLTSRRTVQIPNELLAQLEARRSARERLIQAAVNALPALTVHAPELGKALAAAIREYAPRALGESRTGDSQTGDSQTGDSRIAPTRIAPTAPTQHTTELG